MSIIKFCKDCGLSSDSFLIKKNIGRCPSCFILKQFELLKLGEMNENYFLNKIILNIDEGSIKTPLRRLL